jgi:hypothetical protein
VAGSSCWKVRFSSTQIHRSDHRVDKTECHGMPGFLFSRPNWLLTPPHSQVSVITPPPPLVTRRGHTRMRERGGSQFRRSERRSGTQSTHNLIPLRARQNLSFGIWNSLIVLLDSPLLKYTDSQVRVPLLRPGGRVVLLDSPFLKYTDSQVRMPLLRPSGRVVLLDSPLLKYTDSQVRVPSETR